MAKPRSPILGYNHNIRYRGLVFHVQTEDSGIANPHVFTHLFHGGVILTTRKLVYDPGASDDAVKGLMQAQHKAVLKDLKRGQFDEKIDSYLGGTPGLLPRGQGDDGEAAESGPTTAPLAQPAPVAAGPSAVSIPMPDPARISGAMAAVSADGIDARAPTERFTDAHAAAARGPSPLPPPPRQAMTAPPVQTRPAAEVLAPDPTQAPVVRRDVSAAFSAIMVGDGEAVPPGGGLAEVDDVPVEVRSAAPPSAPPPPGAQGGIGSPGEYAQHRRRDSVPPATAAPPRRPGGTGAMPPLKPPTMPPPRATTTAGVPPPPRAPVTTTPAIRAPSPHAARPSSPPATYPSGRPAPAARTRSPSGGGVVVTRPAVIIGAPPRTVGTGTPPPPAPPASASPPARPSTTRIRKAREETDSGLFGQDLISEKSLDEVILAYLSEDPADE